MYKEPDRMVAGTKVIWRGKDCVVTNACIARGKFIQVSPVGNGSSPAKYYQVFPDEVKLK